MMKKSLIALAIAAAAPAAFADVAMSGKIGASVASVSGTSVTENQKTTGYNNENSVITLSGKEDLGGGMAISYSLTNGLDMGSSATNFAAQNQIIKLDTSVGSVLAGKFDNPMKVMARGYDLFADQVAGDARHITYSGLADARANNVLAYISPSFNGLQVVVAGSNDPAQAAPGTGGQTETDVDGDNDLTMWKLTYSNGPLSAGVAGHTRDTTGDNEKIVRGVAGYKMGDTRLVALYQTNKNIGGTAAADGKAWGLGVAHAMGPITLKAQYYKNNDDRADMDSTLTAVGVDYSLSKRTTVQVAYGKVKNEASVSRGTNNSTDTYSAVVAGADALTSVNGADPSRVSVGLKHTF